MEFTTLLAGCGIEPRNVALCLHKPGNATDRLVLAMLAESGSPHFETYQRTHSRQAEATLKARGVMASFLTRGDGTLTFIGLYHRAGWTDRNAADFDADPAMQALFACFADQRGFVERGIDSRADFDLQPMARLADLHGRLIVADPGARAYMRLSETTPLPVLEITRQADLTPPLPDWRALVLDTATIRALPRAWAETLRHWRGIYLIVDENDGARYVGAAYGTENLLGRWQTHVAGEAGVTRQLALRNPGNFRFSILELLSPTAGIDEVTRIEQGWMERLDTRRFGLNA